MGDETVRTEFTVWHIDEIPDVYRVDLFEKMPGDKGVMTIKAAIRAKLPSLVGTNKMSLAWDGPHAINVRLQEGVTDTSIPYEPTAASLASRRVENTVSVKFVVYSSEHVAVIGKAQDVQKDIEKEVKRNLAYDLKHGFRIASIARSMKDGKYVVVVSNSKQYAAALDMGGKRRGRRSKSRSKSTRRSRSSRRSKSRSSRRSKSSRKSKSTRRSKSSRSRRYH